MTPGNIVFSTSAVLNFHWARLLMGDRRLDMVGWSLLKVELHFIHRMRIIRCSEMVPQITPHIFNRKNAALFWCPKCKKRQPGTVQWWPLIKPAATGQQFSLDVVVRRGSDQINPLRLVQIGSERDAGLNPWWAERWWGIYLLLKLWLSCRHGIDGHWNSWFTQRTKPPFIRRFHSYVQSAITMDLPS